MDAHDDQPTYHAGRIARLYDRLAAILRSGGPRRIERFKNYLHGEALQNGDSERTATARHR